MQIISLVEWNELAQKLAAQGYHPWQWQYDVNQPEGLRVAFCSDDRSDVEIVTHSWAVRDAIMKFKQER